MKQFTEQELAEDLRNLGIRSGDSVMLHSSLSRLGMVEGGAATVVEAFMTAVGDDGTLITPAFTTGAWYGALAMTDCQDGCPRDLCPSQTPSHEGAIPNAALRRDGRLRSCHPTHSWVANGADADAFLVKNRESRTPCDRGTPFDELCERDGCVVILGVGVETITLWHYFEDVLDVPYKGYFHPKERHLSYCAPGLRIQYEYPGIMMDVVRAAGIMTVAKVGRSTSGLIRARIFRQFMATIMADDPYCFLLRPIDRASGNLALDAMQKGAAMLRAWERGPVVDEPTFEWPAGHDDDVVRDDCPAFAGFHDAGGESHALCQANGRHPELFEHGGVFDRYGKTTCGRCPWHRQFPKNDCR